LGELTIADWWRVINGTDIRFFTGSYFRQPWVYANPALAKVTIFDYGIYWLRLQQTYFFA
jgi:hypothetical protein